MATIVGGYGKFAYGEPGPFRRGRFDSIEPQHLVWLALLGTLAAPTVSYLALVLAEQFSLALVPTSSPLFHFLVRWAALILVVPALLLAAVSAGLGRDVARAARTSGLRAAGRLVSVVAVFMVPLTVFWSLSELQFEAGP